MTLACVDAFGARQPNPFRSFPRHGTRVDGRNADISGIAVMVNVDETNVFISEKGERKS